MKNPYKCRGIAIHMTSNLTVVLQIITHWCRNIQCESLNMNNLALKIKGYTCRPDLFNLFHGFSYQSGGIFMNFLTEEKYRQNIYISIWYILII